MKTHRHARQPRITFPKFITRCHFSCLSHYTDSESSSDLQQESLLDNQHSGASDSYHMTGSPWGYHDDDMGQGLDTNIMEASSDGSENEEQESSDVTREGTALLVEQDITSTAIDNITTNVSTEINPQQSNIQTYNMAASLQPASSNHYQMPKFNMRMWQDGFGRFHRDTIPRRDNANSSPVSSHGESVPSDTSAGPPWFISPMLASLNSATSQLTASLKSLSSTSLNDPIDNNNRLCGNGNQQRRTEERIPLGDAQSCISPENSMQGTATVPEFDRGTSHVNGSQLLLPGHSNSLIEVLQSLPNEPHSSPYQETRENNDASWQNNETSCNVTSQGRGDGQGHPSLFELFDQIQQHIQDNTTSTQVEGFSVPDQTSAEPPLQLSISSRSSTWSNGALIEQLLQVLVNNSPDGSTSQRSVSSSQSSNSSSEHHNWYFYDRRLVPNRNVINGNSVAAIPQPPSYEETQAILSNPDTSINFLTQLAILLNDPPPPYPGSDLSPPPSYSSGTCSSAESVPRVGHTEENESTDQRLQGTLHCDTAEETNRLQTSFLNVCPNFTMALESREHVNENQCITGRGLCDSDPEWSLCGAHDHRRSSPLGLSRRPPVRWNRGMRLEQWASTHNWAAESIP